MFSRIYIHIPFCRQKCPYCAFFSQPHSSYNLNDYTDLVRSELTLAARDTTTSGVHSIYFGGGTPSLLEPGQIARLIELSDRLFSLAADAEITLEANPGTVTHGTLTEFRHSGVTRLSLGVQSFDDRMLTELGRIHTGDGARGAYEAARLAGFENIGIDLINSLPGQSLEMWRNDLESAVDLAPEHLSIYGLTIEDGTAFSGRYTEESPLLPGEDLSAEMFEIADNLLTAKDYEHYEIANFARPGCRSRHNSGYWHRDGYLGVGAGAHSFLKDVNHGTRFSNTADLNEYARALQQHHLARRDMTHVSFEDAIAEFMFLGLRMSDGIAYDTFEKEFSINIKTKFGPTLEMLIQQGLMSETGRGVHLTRRGMLLSNQVFQRFLP